MPRLIEEESLLYQALGSPLGLVVRVSDFDQARARLYRARKDARDPDLDVIQLRRSPFSQDELWIVKGGASASTATES